MQRYNAIGRTVLSRWNVRLSSGQQRSDSTTTTSTTTSHGKGVVCAIEAETEVTQEHLTPELPLRLITPHCWMWGCREEDLPFTDPFWGFYWPGGQAVARYVLDVPQLVKDKRVLDLGCGCGAAGIAALKAGAASVVFNDIDPVALQATSLNLTLNNVDLKSTTLEHRNLVEDYDSSIADGGASDWDVILVGDVLYDSDFTAKVITWLRNWRKRGVTVLIGDPGRWSFNEAVEESQRTKGSDGANLNHDDKELPDERDTLKLRCIAQYRLKPNTHFENRGYCSAFCWRLDS